MCLLTKTNRTRLLKKDIIAYKIVWPRDTGTVVSLYHKWEYKIGKVYKKEFKKPFYSKVIAKYVWRGEGFHSFIWLSRERMRFMGIPDSAATLVKCRIPAGSRVAVCKDTGEMVSDHIIIMEKCKCASYHTNQNHKRRRKI